jgi:hypothetical protein
MLPIQKLDAELTKLQSQFEVISKETSFTYICSLADEATVAQQKYEGIYLIEIRTTGRKSGLASWYKQFKEGWEHPSFRKAFTPNTRKVRIDAHSTLKPWMPLYIGKAKSVAGRVKQHISLDLSATTFALKLRARTHLRLSDLRLSTVNLEQLAIQNYGVIAPVLELALRNQINPLVGKQ